MITYFLDTEKKHYDDLLFHLRKHNTKHTGEKLRKTYYIYALKDDVLQGAMKTTLSWDWVGISNIHYNNLDVLHSMLCKVQERFKERSGISIYTKEKQICDDFVQLGFNRQNPLTISPKRKTSYVATLMTEYKTEGNKYHTLSSEEVIVEYDDVMKEKQREYLKRNDIQEPSEYILYSAIDEEEYVGGIYLELYEDSLYVDLLAVNETYRGRKVGTKLMDFALQEAINRDFVSIDLGTAEFQAREFYEKLGYQVVASKQNQPKGFECYTLIKNLKE